MKIVYRVLPWAVLLFVITGVALIAPHAQPAWLPRVALALMGFGGAYNIVRSITGFRSRRLPPVAALGTLLIGIGFILFGTQWLPGAPLSSTLSLIGLGLAIVGMMLQISSMKAVGRI